MSGFLIAYDVTRLNYGQQPKGKVCLYVTGSPDIMATPAMLAANPDCVTIDQSPAPGIWDKEADVDDFENGAVLLSELPSRARARIASFEAGTRPGQRRPLIYFSANRVHEVVNELVNNGVTSGVGLFIADWSLTEAQAVQDVVNAAGPFPIEGVQFKNAGPFDIDVFSSEWFNDRSKVANPPPVNQPPPGQWNDPKVWTWKSAAIVGIGLDGLQYVMVFDPDSGNWVNLTPHPNQI